MRLKLYDVKSVSEAELLLKIIQRDEPFFFCLKSSGFCHHRNEQT